MTSPVLDRLRTDPALPMRVAGLTPDAWQEDLIRCGDRQVMALCTRRSGKTRSTACKVLARCLLGPTRVLIFAPTEEQSVEIVAYVREMNDALGCPVPIVSDTETRIKWANGSSVRAKADRAKSSRGPTPNLIVIDEAAQVSDLLYLSVAPMQVLGQCDFLALSTPFGKLGWFFDAWESAGARWTKFKVTAHQCPRIDRAVLAEHEATMPPRWFAQEYLCEFNDAVDAVFGKLVIESAVKTDDAFLPLAL